jgi:hypothetical protein
MHPGKIWKTWRATAGQVFAELFGGLLTNGPIMAISSRFMMSVPTTLTYGVSIATNALLGNVFKVSITDAVAFDFAAPTNPPAATEGQIITYLITNASGGAHGAGTFNAAFKTAGNLAAIANNKQRAMSFAWNGVNWIELYRGAADVAV